MIKLMSPVLVYRHTLDVQCPSKYLLSPLQGVLSPPTSRLSLLCPCSGYPASKLLLGYPSRGTDLSLTSAAPWSFNSCHPTDEKISISLLISRAHLSCLLFLSHSSLGCTLPISYPTLLGKEPSHYRVFGPPNLVKSFFLDLPREPGQSGLRRALPNAHN